MACFSSSAEASWTLQEGSAAAASCMPGILGLTVLRLAVTRLRYSQKAAVKKKYHCCAFVPVIGRPSGPPPRRASLNSSRHISTWRMTQCMKWRWRVSSLIAQLFCRVIRVWRMTPPCAEGLYAERSQVAPLLQLAWCLTPVAGRD